MCRHTIMNKLSQCRVPPSLAFVARRSVTTAVKRLVAQLRECETTEDFRAAVQETRDNPRSLLVVDFFAQWCGPCRVIKAELENFQEEFSESKLVSFRTVDIDNLPNVADENEIDAMPTVKLIKEGREIAKFIGAHTADRIRDEIEAIVDFAVSKQNAQRP